MPIWSRSSGISPGAEKASRVFMGLIPPRAAPPVEPCAGFLAKRIVRVSSLQSTVPV